MQNKLWLVALILFGMGAIFAGIAGFMFYQQYKLEQSGLRAGGVVIAMVSSTDNDGSTTYAPVVRFKTQNGRSYEFQSSFFASPPDYKVGDEVTVLYPPDRPAEAQIKGEGQLFIIIFGIVGGIEIIIGLFFTGKTVLAVISGE
jgi:hypothetical protein